MKNHHRNDSWIGVGNQWINGRCTCHGLPYSDHYLSFCFCPFLPSTGLLDNGKLSVVCRIVASKDVHIWTHGLLNVLPHLASGSLHMSLNRDVEMRWIILGYLGGPEVTTGALIVKEAAGRSECHTGGSDDEGRNLEPRNTSSLQVLNMAKKWILLQSLWKEGSPVDTSVSAE